MKKLDEVKTKVKTVWKEHGKEIVICTIGVSAVVIGYVAGKRIKGNAIYDMVGKLKTFNPDDNGYSIFKNINMAIAGSNYAAVPCGGCEQTLEDTFNVMRNFYESNAIDLSTEVTGAVFFLNKK